MRNDHAFHGRTGGADPTPKDIQRYMARARRMRSETVHQYLAHAVAWMRRALRPARGPKEPVGQCC